MSLGIGTAVYGMQFGLEGFLITDQFSTISIAAFLNWLKRNRRRNEFSFLIQALVASRALLVLEHEGA